MGLGFGYGMPLDRRSAIDLVRAAFDPGAAFFDTGEGFRPRERGHAHFFMPSYPLETSRLWA